ncbi:hypothetical protein AALP_AA7G092100 [Arabis alpina]|uniref:Uncharacterized protein n=1 Tax=Arabis alpina TaxID=50452 RepID=A0A087GGX3_ARAAL|nr:hypothetical protein AALP_AA7G092100 [Arabis alpina]
MFKRDDYIRTKHDAVFTKWQGFARSMLLRKPFSETEELRRTFADYSSISGDLGPKILLGANGREYFRKEKDFLGRYRVQGSLPGLCELGVAVIGHDQGQKADSDDHLVTENIRSRIHPYGTRHNLLKKLGENEFRKTGLSQTILPLTQKKISNRTEDKQHDLAEGRESSCDPAILRLSRSRPHSGLDRHDDIVDGSVCGVLLQDGTICTTTPIEGRKRCTEHKGQRISSVSVGKHIPCEVPTRRECEENENICGVILPDMVPCRSKPVSRRKRCEDHKGMRTNAFFFLMNPTERDKAFKEEKSKPDTRTGSMDQENLGPGLSCEATTKSGLPCTRIPPNGCRRCWQHKDKTMDHRSSENIQSTVKQVMCGVKLYNGSVCDKSLVKGRKRCEEHKGMRVTS